MAEVINLCDAVVAHCKSPMGDFLAESLLDGCTLAKNILSRDDLAATTKAVQVCEESRCNIEGDGTLVDGGAVEGFFLEHALVRSLFDLAVDHVKTGEKQGKVQESLQGLATGLETLTAACSSQGLKLIAALQPVQDSVDKCITEVLGLKASKGDPNVANVKLVSKAWEKCNNALGSYKEGFRPEDARAAGGRDESKPVRASAPWHLQFTISSWFWFEYLDRRISSFEIHDFNFFTVQHQEHAPLAGFHSPFELDVVASFFTFILQAPFT